MTTRLTPPRPVLGQWLVDEQVWVDSWLLVEERHWFKLELFAVNYYLKHGGNKSQVRLEPIGKIDL